MEIIKVKQNQQKVFVTGASGFIGRNTCLYFLKKNYVVFGLTRQKGKEILPKEVIVVHGDLLDPNLWQDQIKSVDIVVHCAGNPKFGNGLEYFKDNVTCTQNLLKVSNEAIKNLKRFVFISSIAAVDRAFGDSCKFQLREESIEAPTTDYGKSKKIAENMVKKSGLPFVIIRPAQVVGKSMRQTSHFSVFAKWVLDKNVMSWFSWPGIFSVVDVEDLASAIFICTENKKAKNNLYLCGGHHISLNRFFNEIKVSWRINVSFLKPIIRYCPFSIKSLFFPCLKIDDSALRSLGWSPKKSLWQSLEPVINREKARNNVEHCLNFGQTVITGAGSGLGRAFVEYLAPIRKNILLIDRDRATLEELSGRFENCQFVVCDLGNDEEQEKLLNSQEWNSTSVLELFACAGYGRRGPFSEDSTHQQLGMIKVNMLSRMRLSHKVLPQMINHQFGRIVLISSSSAFQALPGMTSYSASNAGLLLFGEGLFYEVKNFGVKVLTVCPGGMKTGFQKSAGVKELKNENLMTPQDVVKEVMVGLNGQAPVLMVSFRSKAMSWIARLLPRKINLTLWGWLMSKAR
jgi:short-subunit dehydrogenase